MVGALLVVSLVALTLSLAVTPVVQAFATRHEIGDYPSSRKIHTKFVPRLGGAAIILGFVAGVGAAALLVPASFSYLKFSPPALLSGLGLIVLLGVYDDVRGIGSVGKLTVQFLASALVVSSNLEIRQLTIPFLKEIGLGMWSLPITLLWLVGITNAINLLDGLDGLAAGVAAIVSGAFVGIGLYTGDGFLTMISASLTFACVGFLRYNFHPASIFMGDTGSLFLGFVLACVSLQVLQDSTQDARPLSLLVVVAALAVPIVDTSVAFFRRLKRGMHPLKADKEHIHHRLMDLGLTHRQTVVAIYAISIFNAAVAFLLVVVGSLYAVLFIAITVVSMFVGIRRLGYVEEMRLRRTDEMPPIRPLSVARVIDRALLVLSDLVAIAAAFLASYWFRFESGFFAGHGFVPLEFYVLSPAVMLLLLLWLAIFWLLGLYEMHWDVSRIDYGIAILKATAIGTIIIFLVTFDLSSITLEGRLTTLVYGGTVGLFVLIVRMALIAFERKHEILGYRRRNTILVGMSRTAEELVHEIRKRSELKYNLIGVVDRQPDRAQFMDLPVLGDHDSIPQLVRKWSVEEVLVATTYDAREEILDIVARCNGVVPDVKVAPESMDVLSGFKFEQVIGHPLVRLYPVSLRTWQRIVKRSLDMAVSLLVLVPFLPVWLLIAAAIRIDSPGPALFVQERVGKRGKIFRLYKYRSMIRGAEDQTGPVWATPDDKRATRLGRLLRRFRLDEVPQFINVLRGEMSLVGPRPERPYFVDQLKKEVSFYARRLLVRPGITGWAQVKHQYDESLSDVREKIKYDLYYLENVSLTLDLKILFRTFVVALSGKVAR
jgi:exopolysaccharide biosynthesis polyprenyl glycosylphosphotransferase